MDKVGRAGDLIIQCGLGLPVHHPSHLSPHDDCHLYRSSHKSERWRRRSNPSFLIPSSPQQPTSNLKRHLAGSSDAHRRRDEPHAGTRQVSDGVLPARQGGLLRFPQTLKRGAMALVNKPRQGAGLGFPQSSHHHLKNHSESN